jgi:hypothetical protein
VVLVFGSLFFWLERQRDFLTWGFIDLDCFKESVVARREIAKMARLQVRKIANATRLIYEDVKRSASPLSCFFTESLCNARSIIRKQVD